MLWWVDRESVMKKIRPLTEADVTAESAFFMQRRQVLKALGISAAALSLPSTAQADSSSVGLKATIVRKRLPVNRLSLVSLPPGEAI